MSDIAIRVEHLSKRYRLGQREAYKNLREVLTNAAKAPIGWIHRQRADTAESDPGYFWALDDISFEVKQGEAVGIIGRNGAGKSTLLKILSRITKPTRGQAEIYGRVGSLLEVGTGFHPELTGRENIYLNGAILGMHRGEIARKFDEIVAFSEIEQFLDTPVKRYSSGMYVRLAFAVAAHLEPEILLVDEVLAVGDIAFQKKCLGKMGEVATAGRTVLFVSHNMNAIDTLCSRALLIRRGVVDCDGETRGVISNYLNDAKQSETGFFDCIDHPARRTQKGSVIQSITLCGEDFKPTNKFTPHSLMKVKINIKSSFMIKEPKVAIAVEDDLGRRLFTAASYFKTENLLPAIKSGKIACEISDLQLGAGRFLISASVSSKYEGLIDSIDGAAWFYVEWNNSFDTGQDYYPIFGPILVNSSWKLDG